MWINFDPGNLPPDGSYMARREIPGRADNPHYGKLTVLNRHIPAEAAMYITHYAIDPGISEQQHKATLQCPSCGSIITVTVT